ncbi:TRAP-like protein sporozoite-specific transmembrane, putative [Plasmodium gaboni]|uniref:TRAP-like protein sporozoite-specific transmembrane, putative n=1 Tax=Plasmodium gaboni TaxID=647221 RepID=A0ABY1UVC7_9APIC|nr:TRAP-like protein sporozoite-specific transmembrane, putative [Plasmodium gaboni]
MNFFFFFIILNFFMLSLTSSLRNGFLQLDSSTTFSEDFCKGMNLHFLISSEEIDSKFFLNKILLLILGGTSYMRYNKQNYFSVSIYDKKIVYKNIKKIENIRGASYYEQLQSAFKKYIKYSGRKTNLLASLKEYYEKYIVGNKNIKESKNIIILVKRFTSDDLFEFDEDLNRYIKEIRSKDVGIYFISDDSIHSKNMILNISETVYNMEVDYPIAHFVSESFRSNDLYGVKKFCYQLLHGATCESYNEWSEWSGPCEFERRQRIIPLKITNTESTSFRSHYDPSCRNVFDYNMAIKEDFRANCKNIIYECRGICDKGYRFKPYTKYNEIMESYEECKDLPPCTKDQKKNGDHTLYSEVILNSLLSEASLKEIRDREDRTLIEKDMPGDTEEMSNERRIKDTHIFLDNKMKYLIDKQHKLIEQLQKDIQDRKNKKEKIEEKKEEIEEKKEEIEEKKEELEEKKEEIEEKKEELEEKKEEVEQKKAQVEEKKEEVETKQEKDKENQEQQEDNNLQDTKRINETPTIDMKNNENTVQNTQKVDEIKKTNNPIDNFENDGTNKIHVINTGSTNTQSSQNDLDGDNDPNRQNVLNNQLNKLADKSEKDSSNVFSVPINGENIKKNDIYEHPQKVDSAEDVNIIENPIVQSIENRNNIINMNNKYGNENSSKNKNSEIRNISVPFDLNHLNKKNDYDGISEYNENTSSYDDKKEDVEINLERKVVEQTNEQKETDKFNLNNGKEEENIDINKENKEGDISRNNGENVEIYPANNGQKMVNPKGEDLEKNVNVKDLSEHEYGHELESKRIIGGRKNEDKEIENKNSEDKKIIQNKIDVKQIGAKEIENELIGGKQIEDKKIKDEQINSGHIEGEQINGVHVEDEHIDREHIGNHNIKVYQIDDKQGTSEKNQYNNTKDSSVPYGKDKEEEYLTESSNIKYTPYTDKNIPSMKIEKIYEPHMVEELNKEDKLSKENIEKNSNDKKNIRTYEQENHKINENEEEERNKIKYKNLNIKPQVNHKISDKNINDDKEDKKYEFANTEETYKNNEKNHNLIGKNEVSGETIDEYILSPKPVIKNEQERTPQYEEFLTKKNNNDEDNGKRINNNDQLPSPIVSNEKNTDDINIIEEKEKIYKLIHNNDIQNQNNEKKNIQDEKLKEFSSSSDSKEMKNISSENTENNILSHKKKENHKIIHQSIEEDTTSKDNEKNMKNYIINDDMGKKYISRENTGEDNTPNKYGKNKGKYDISDDKEENVKIYEENNEEHSIEVGNGENKATEGNSDHNIMKEENGENKNLQQNSDDNIMTESNGKIKSSQQNSDDNIMQEEYEKDKISQQNSEDNIIPEENGKNKSSQENIEDDIVTEENGKNKSSQQNSDDNIMPEENGKNKNSEKNKEEDIASYEIDKKRISHEADREHFTPYGRRINKEFHKNVGYNIVSGDNGEKNISAKNISEDIIPDENGKNKNYEENIEEDKISDMTQKSKISHKNVEGHFTPYESGKNKRI